VERSLSYDKSPAYDLPGLGCPLPLKPVFGHGFEDVFFGQIDALLDMELVGPDRDEVVVVDCLVLATAAVGGAGARRGHNDAVPGMKPHGRDVGNMEVAAEDQFDAGLPGRLEGFFGAAGEVVPRKGDELGKVVVHDEHAQGLARGAVIPGPDLLKLLLRDAPTLHGPAKCRIDSFDGHITILP